MMSVARLLWCSFGNCDKRGCRGDRDDAFKLALYAVVVRQTKQVGQRVAITDAAGSHSSAHEQISKRCLSSCAKPVSRHVIVLLL